MREQLGVAGHLTMHIATTDPDAAVIDGMDWDRRWVRGDDGLWHTAPAQHNAFLNQGLQAILRRYASIAAIPAAPTGIGVSSDNTAVTAATTTFGGTFRYSAFDATFPSLAGQTASFQASFTKGAGAGQVDFSVRKVGVTNATTDAAGAVQDIIGGGGGAPYNEPITIDLTAAAAFTISPRIDVSLVAI